jgi:hypothetical protein
MATGNIKINIKVVKAREFQRSVNKGIRAFKQLSKTISSLRKAHIEYQKFIKLMEKLKAAKIAGGIGTGNGKNDITG